MKFAIATCACIGIFTVVFADAASAAVWRWGCMGEIGEDQIIFTRYQLIVVPAKPPRGKLRDLIFLDDLAKSSEDFENYNADDGNSGLVRKMEFTRNDNEKRKLILTEKSSKRISHHSKLICGRDEIIDEFRKVYRYERDDEPVRNVTLQCMDYLLSTRGGRPCN